MPALAGCLSLKSERKKISRFYKSSAYSRRSNILVWMVSILTLISNSSSLFTQPFWTVPSAPTISGITVTFVLYTIISIISTIHRHYTYHDAKLL